MVEPAILGDDDEAELSQWLEPDEAEVRLGQPIAEVAASKANVEIPAPASGRLRHLLAAGAPVIPGQQIGVIS